MEMRLLLKRIAILFLLSLLLVSCGYNTSPGGTTTNTPTPTIDQATVTPTIDQATATPPPTPTIDQATATPTIDQSQATPTPTIDQSQATATPTIDQSQATPTPTIDQATATPPPTPTIDQATATPPPTIDQGQPTPTPTSTSTYYHGAPTWSSKGTITPTPLVSPTQLNPSTCTSTVTGWDCSVYLWGPIGTPIDWSVTSANLPATDITYTQSSGTLSADSHYQQTVTISIASIDCQNSTGGGIFIFSFSGGAGGSKVTWSCS